ncbi:hypothetical protein [Deinococcus saxicola]|uniref:hypothetical protein n=1 Tax=Deinococcus saxicola TaxID=249406 RepID=UPI0039EE6D2F
MSRLPGWRTMGGCSLFGWLVALGRVLVFVGLVFAGLVFAGLVFAGLMFAGLMFI